MTIILDGEERTVPDGSTVAAVLEILGEPPPHVLVELNGTHLPPEDQGKVMQPGDRLEIIHPAFGG